MTITTLPQIAWPDARPEWDDLTAPEQLDHIESCESCALCENGRAWGECSTCWKDAEALPPEGLSRCCGSMVALVQTAEDNLLARRAA